MAIEPNGDIVAGGYGQSGGQTVFTLTRYLPSGALDPSFGSGGQVLTSFGDINGQACASIALQPNGDILAAGSLYGSHGETQWMAVVRYLPSGALDPSFGIAGHVLLKPGGKISGATSLVLDKNGGIIVGGSIGQNFALVRLNSNGALDRGFGSGGTVVTFVSYFTGTLNSQINTLSLDKSGDIVAGGYLYTEPQFPPVETAVARYLPSGMLDRSFATGGVWEEGEFRAAASIALEGDGKILIGGVDIANASAVIRISTAGNFDTTFGAGGIAEVSPEPVPTPGSNFSYPPVTALAIESDGKILAADGSDLSRLLKN